MPPSRPNPDLRSRDRLGLIGLGLMGMAFAERWLGSGEAVLGWDIDQTRLDRLLQLGGAGAKDADEVGRSCSRILLSLPDDTIVRTTLQSLRQHLRPGQVIIDTSTGRPEAAEQIGRELANAGIDYLDATVSGNSAQVQSGQILFLVGGSPEVFVRCQGLLAGLAAKTLHLGPWGTGAKMKLVTNLVLGLNRAALAEGLVLAQGLGITPADALAVLRESMAYSRVMETKGEKMVRADFSPQARLSQHLKDVRLMIESAAAAGKKLPLSETHRHLLEKAEALGLGALDNSAIIKAIRD